MSTNLRKMQLLSVSSSIVTVYVNIFINLFIWEKHNNVGEVALFNLTTYSFLLFIYIFGSYLLTKKDLRFNMFLSSTFAILTFAILLFAPFHNDVVQIVSVALSFAITKGFYYSGANYSVSLFGKSEEEFATYFSTQAVLNFLVNVAVPLLGAFIIHYFDYRASFIVMLFLSSSMLLISFTIPKVTLPKEDHFLSNLSYKKVFTEKRLHFVALSSFAFGIFSQFLIFFTLIFTFSVTENKFYIAGLNVLYALLTFTALKIMKRNQKLRSFHWLLIGLFLVVTGCAFVIFLHTPLFILLANICFTIGLFYLDNINKSQHFGLFAEYDTSTKSHLLIWRETLLGISRSLLLVLVLFLDNATGPLFIFILVFSLFVGFTIPFMNKQFVSKRT